MPSPPSKLTPAKSRLLDRVVAHHFQPIGAERLAYIPSQLVQCTFPHNDPGNVSTWSRSTPWLTVTFQPGFKKDKRTKQQVCVGFPYGTIPRLLMFYLMTEIEYKKNNPDLTPQEKRTVLLGGNVRQFMTKIGLNPNNGTGIRSDKRRLKDQIERFMRVRVNFEQDNNSGDGYDFSDMLIAEEGRFWWASKSDDESEQSEMFESHVVLSEKFYQRILQNLVPLDVLALKALKNSALHLDIYAWCLYRSQQLNKGKKAALVVPWKSFMDQSGASYTRVRDFRAAVIKALPTVRPFLRKLRVEADEKGISLYPDGYQLIPERPQLTRLISEF